MENPLLWTLVAIQIVMGGFDTVFHHEGTERLAWRASQKTELTLHGVRNLFYAIIFFAFAWCEPHGAFAIALSLILATEVIVTLWDFVEEDLTRKLPWTERINHTLLTLNYGAILILAAPILWSWAHLPTALVPANYGWASIMSTIAALGVVLFGIRDLLAATRSERLTSNRGDAAKLVTELPERQHVLVTGGTGFIGSRLVEALVLGGHIVTIVTRNVRHAENLCHPVRIITSLDQIHDDEHLDIIVNLAGEPIANGLWTSRKKARIIVSREDTTRAAVALIDRLRTKPACVISGSAIGWYGLREDETLTECSGSKPAFVHDVCDRWENAAAPISATGVRVVLLRIGLVMGIDGGLLSRLLTPVEFGGGAQLGSGQQWMSWIELDDLIRVIARAMVDDTLSGPVNAVAPNPVRNEEFTRALAKALHRPALIRIPAVALKALLGQMGQETMLGGQRVLPAKLQKRNFSFTHPNIAPMLQHITGGQTSKVPEFEDVSGRVVRQAGE